MADAADHAWTIAVATGSTPLPPHSPALRHSGGGLNVAARHILLALYLDHRDLHLPDPQLPAPQAAALTPEAWADTAPEEIAAYLRITCRQFNTALGLRKGTPYPLSALLYPAHHRHPAQQKPPEDRASFRDAHLAAPDEATATRTSASTSEASRRASERHTAGTPAPCRPHGDRGVHPPPTPTRPRRQRQVRGPASAPASKARCPDQGPGPATWHHPTPRPPGHTNKTAPASAHHHHRTAAPKPCSPVSHHCPHTSTPCQDHHTRRARGHGTTNTTTTPPSLATPTP